MPLPERFVERIFSRLLVRYGSAWLRMWDGVEMDDVKADWAEQLDGFENSPLAIKFALENLPEKPPTILQFKALCINRPVYARVALPVPAADPQKVEAALAKLAEVKANVNPRAWAHRLKEREAAGEKLTQAQKTMWRAALDTPDYNESSIIGDFNPIQNDVLPPGMKRHE
jgi:hypothetical protein